MLSTCPYSRLTGVMNSFSAVGTAWPTTRPTHSFLKFCAYPLNVLPSGFRPLDGDDPADPFIAREWRNILPFCSRRRVRNENFSQIRWYSVYRTTGDRSLGHRFQSISNWRGTCPCSRQSLPYRIVEGCPSSRCDLLSERLNLFVRNAFHQYTLMGRGGADYGKAGQASSF